MNQQPEGDRKTDTRERSRPDLVGILTLAGLVLLGLACWWLVPWFMHVVKHQDCIGSGATNC